MIRDAGGVAERNREFTARGSGDAKCPGRVVESDDEGRRDESRLQCDALEEEREA